MTCDRVMSTIRSVTSEEWSQVKSYVNACNATQDSTLNMLTSSIPTDVHTQKIIRCAQFEARQVGMRGLRGLVHTYLGIGICVGRYICTRMFQVRADMYTKQ